MAVALHKKHSGEARLGTLMMGIPSAPKQAVILCGGIGSRLGALTARTPKPLLSVAGRPFLAYLIDNIAAQGIQRVVLLAAFEAGQIEAFAAICSGPTVTVVREPERAGTAGALAHAAPALDEDFLLLNGDSWFDIPLSALAWREGSEDLCIMSLRRPLADGRYGAVRLEGDRITAFGATVQDPEMAFINAGIYRMRREITRRCPEKGSLEENVFPQLARERLIAGRTHDGYFIDIGVPDDYARAQTELPSSPWELLEID